MKYAKSLGHLTPDVALYDQGSDVTYTCRRDLLTNVRQLATPCYFDRPKGFRLPTTHNVIFYHRHNRETVHNVPYTNGK
ncbi:hypothetical protein E3Q13_02200 [Wallemia mellicola]|nr:hypothetical protein E3Q13_02200 [Wallemia mellicola]